MVVGGQGAGGGGEGWGGGGGIYCQKQVHETCSLTSKLNFRYK